jgi:hypothetical protein
LNLGVETNESWHATAADAVYLLARTRPDQSSHALGVYPSITEAAEAAMALSELEPHAVFRVCADGPRTVFVATAGRGHRVRTRPITDR